MIEDQPLPFLNKSRFVVVVVAVVAAVVVVVVATKDANFSIMKNNEEKPVADFLIILKIQLLDPTCKTMSFPPLYPIAAVLTGLRGNSGKLHIHERTCLEFIRCKHLINFNTSITLNYLPKI